MTKTAAKTLDLFPRTPPLFDRVVHRALGRGAHLVVSVSGGKDSQAMLARLAGLRTAYGWTCPMTAVHADLGRAEWPETAAFVERMCRADRVPLTVVRRNGGDLVERIERRLQTVSTIPGETRPAKPFWPSAAQRYCTSDLKRGPIQMHLRSLGKEGVIVSAMGLRADESRGRAAKPGVSVDAALTSKALRDFDPATALQAQREDGGRLVLNWLPIHDWATDDVWEMMLTDAEDLERRRALYREGHHKRALNGWPAHPAYVMGNTRLSCALCVLASRSDLVNGMRHNPALAAHYIGLEKASGYTFRDGLSLTDLAAEEMIPLEVLS